jgi:hypothetical protein
MITTNIVPQRSYVKPFVTAIEKAQKEKPLPANWRQQIIDDYAKPKPVPILLKGEIKWVMRPAPDHTPGAPLPCLLVRINDSDGHIDETVTIEATALAYARRGWKPVPVNRKTKKPIGSGWETRPFAPAQFNGNAQNVAVQLGTASGGLTDVDLDCTDAIGFAPEFLPATEAIFGRRSKPCSHQLYVTDLYQTEKKAVLNFKGPAGVIVELRIGGNGKGATTIFPPSMHVTGESVCWEREGEPACVSGDDLKRAVLHLAVACLLKQHYPVNGSRHDGALVIGGVLARAGWQHDDIAHVMGVVARAARDDEVEDRVTAARSAVELRANGDDLPGLPRMRELWGDDAAKTIAKWINYREVGSAKGAGLEDSVALAFAEQHAEDFRYVAASSQWMRWTGKYWEIESTLSTFDESRKLCRQAGDGRAKVVAAVVTLARSDRRIAATTEQWDRDAWAFNTEDR